MNDQPPHTEIGNKPVTVLDMPLDTLGTFTTRIIKALTRAKIVTVRDLVGLTEQKFCDIPGIGKAATLDVKYRLYVRGLAFREADAPDGTMPLPLPMMHERLARIEARLDVIENHSLLRTVGDMSGHKP